MRSLHNQSRRWWRSLLLTGLLLTLLVGCQTPVAQVTPTPTATATSAAPTPTPALPSPTPDCVYAMRLEADTLEDPPLVAPGAQLAYSWTLRNTGTCPWPAATRLVHEMGATFGLPTTISVGGVLVDELAVVPLLLTAPEVQGTITGLWRLVDGAGSPIGEQLPLTLRVMVGTVTPPPTLPPPTSTPPPPPTSTPPPPPTGTPPTPTPAAEPTVVSFSANVDIADPGDAFLLSWETRGATTATLWYLLPTGQFGEFWEVPPSGSFAYDTNEWQRNGVTFMIYAANAAGAHASATLSVPLRCTGEWFFANPPDICPYDPPLASAAAEQQFEHGTMIWIGEQDRIVVLFDDGQSYAYESFSDEWDPGEPESDPDLEPPAGLYQPVRGFGLVWREAADGRVRERLGWALAPEVGYATLVQTTSYWKYNHTYILAQDGMVWHLLAERSAWEKIPR